MKRFGIMTTALPAKGSKLASLRTYVPGKTWQLFHQAGRKYGLQVIYFRAEDVDFTKSRVHAWRCSSGDGNSGWSRTYHPLPDVVFENCFMNLVSSDPRILAVKRQFIRAGIPTFNPGLFNKSGFHRLLSHSDKIRRYLPPAKTVHGPADVLTFLKKHRTVYLKPINGSGGAGIIQAELLKDLRINVRSDRFSNPKVLNQTMSILDFEKFLNKQIKKRSYLVQKGLQLLTKGEQKIDFRVVVHRGADGQWISAGIRPKLGKAGSIVTNSHAGGQKTTWNRLSMWAAENDLPLPDRELIEEAALSVAQHLTKFRPTLSHLGIDVAVDIQKNIYVLDINPRPGRDLLTKAMLSKVTDLTVGFASYLANKKQAQNVRQ